VFAPGRKHGGTVNKLKFVVPYKQNEIGDQELPTALCNSKYISSNVHARLCADMNFDTLHH